MPYRSTKIENPVEFDLADYTGPLQFKTDAHGGYVTHEVLVSHSAYTLAKMWLDGFKWSENMWGEVMDETPKALLVAVCAKMWWIPKRLLKKARKVREVEEVDG